MIVNLNHDTQFSAITKVIEDVINDISVETVDTATTHDLSGVEGDIDWGDMMNQLGGNEGGESKTVDAGEGSSEIDWSVMMSSTDMGQKLMITPLLPMMLP